MSEYTVTWGIDLDAESPRDAAEKALAILTSDDPENIGKAFDVIDPDGKESTIDLSPGAGTADVDLSTDEPPTTCRHCGRAIEKRVGLWIDPEATGDDAIWRETCDAHDTRVADHEPVE